MPPFPGDEFDDVDPDDDLRDNGELDPDSINCVATRELVQAYLAADAGGRAKLAHSLLPLAIGRGLVCGEHVVAGFRGHYPTLVVLELVDLDFAELSDRLRMIRDAVAVGGHCQAEEAVAEGRASWIWDDPEVQQLP